MLAREQQALEAEIKRAVQAEQTAQERLQQARERLREVTETQGREITRLQQELDTLNAEESAAGSTRKVLHLLDHTLVLHQQMWEQRYQIEHAQDPKALDGALAALQRDLDRLASWRAYLRSDLDTTRRRVDSQEQRLAEWRPEYGDRELAGRELRAYAQQEAVLRRALAKADELDGVLRSWQEAMRLRKEKATLSERLRGLGSDIAELAGKLWNFELLAVEDKIVVEGREIIGKRSVTIGKITQVLLILGVGLWLAARMADYGRRLMMRCLPGKESAALLIYRLFSLLAVVGLVVFALITVNIPLTVFAFLGGALAIGVGFGAQNILNNFISGLILLVERPIKLDDIVEVEGIRGRITHIGARCCEVRRFDGIDMLIPNSSFLEKNVTNWTLSDPQLRCTITVGVDYGASTRDAAALVKRAVEEHRQPLKDPAPEVYLEDFGNDALILRLDFWVDISIDPNWHRVMSDIRYRIEDALRRERHHHSLPAAGRPSRQPQTHQGRARHGGDTGAARCQ